MFGDVEGYTYATEEQGRKTLHAHFLIWLKNWNSVLDGIGEISVRDLYSEVLKKHSDAIKSTILYGTKNISCSCGNMLMSNAKKM